MFDNATWTIETVAASDNDVYGNGTDAIILYNLTDPTPNSFNSTAPVERRWLLLLLGIVPVWILGGNLLVLLAVCFQRNLRTLSNWVIASLAVTDFLLALIVVPLGVYQVVSIKYQQLRD